MKGGTLGQSHSLCRISERRHRHKRIIDNDACLHRFVRFVQVIHKHHHRATHSRSGHDASVPNNLRQTALLHRAGEPRADLKATFPASETPSPRVFDTPTSKRCSDTPPSLPVLTQSSKSDISLLCRRVYLKTTNKNLFHKNFPTSVKNGS
ncbi:hypothetical protein L3Q82_012168 [Scortum barcoo]|uniref:Uncharacterized protein n=1 Tax=Scortum barcoo TaxID=214431 RepID=A0ACB8W8M9_9TELE|nr:hypothetical protein L3Q82_012168 [Scortum barcoo]